MATHSGDIEVTQGVRRGSDADVKDADGAVEVAHVERGDGLTPDEMAEGPTVTRWEEWVST